LSIIHVIVSRLSTASLSVAWVVVRHLSCCLLAALLSVICIVVHRLCHRPLSALLSVICVVVHWWHHVGVCTSPLHLQCGFDVCGCVAIIIATNLVGDLATNLATNLITRHWPTATTNAALPPMPLPPLF
jgi:hypothetical protein